MSLVRSTLTAIQQAGAAVYAADADLKQATQTYAARVAAAMEANPFGLGNDVLFENWKITARLSQSMAVIEAELKKIYFLAEGLVGEDAPVVTALPTWVAPVDARATDVEVKSKVKASKAKKSTKSTRTRPQSQRKRATSAGAPLPGNAAKLLKHLETLLTTDDFRLFKPTVCARTVGIPLGSVTAAIKMLVARGYLVAGAAGSFKLNRIEVAEVVV